MKRTIIILLDCFILAGVLPGCGTAIMGLVDVLAPRAEAGSSGTDFITVVPSVAERETDAYPVANEASHKAAKTDPPGEKGAIEAAIEVSGNSPAPVAALPPDPAPVPAVHLPAPLKMKKPSWGKPILPKVTSSSGPVERSVAAPGSALDTAVQGLVAKLGPVPILKTTVHNESGDPDRLVAIYAMNQREVLVVDPIDDEGRVSVKALALFENLLRSARTDDVHPIDARLVRLLHAVALAHDGVLMVSSGYREPGHGTKPTSMHTKGMAADVKHPYLPAKSIADFAREWGAGGVGYYPKTTFVHLDVREKPFYWIDYSAKGEKGKVVADMDGLLADFAAAKWEGVESDLFNAQTGPAPDLVELETRLEDLASAEAESEPAP
ncbi:MAG: YcbK family protein [Deltaproteobacteria bacterium]|nr:YcbK family protein [Deltaproteobacteria bacterium]